MVDTLNLVTTILIVATVVTAPVADAGPPVPAPEPTEKLSATGHQSQTDPGCSLTQTGTKVAREDSTFGVLDPRTEDDLLVLLGGFEDTEPTYDASEFEEAYFGTGPEHVNGTGTVRDFWYEATDGMINLSAGPAGVRGWYETDMKRDDVTGEWQDILFDDLTPDDNSQFVRKVIEKADQDGVDFSAYDNNGDGCIAVVVVYQNASFRARAFPLFGDFFTDADFAVDVDGVSVVSYARVQEQHTHWRTGEKTGHRETVGTPAHELGHLYGLPDLYTMSTGNDWLDELAERLVGEQQDETIGIWGLMAHGNRGKQPAERSGASPTHPTAWSKLQLLQSADPRIDTVSEYLTTIPRSGRPGILPPAATHTEYYRIEPRAVEGCDACDGQYYLLSYRKRVGFDRGLERWVGDNDSLRIMRINGPWDGDWANEPGLIEGANRLDGYGTEPFNAGTEPLATLADGSDSGIDLRNFEEKYGAATFNDPPDRHLEANTSAVYAIAVDHTLPDGTDTGDDWLVDHRVAIDGNAEMTVEIGAGYDSGFGDFAYQEKATGQDFVQVKMSQDGFGGGVDALGVKAIHHTNATVDYVSASTYPTYPLPSGLNAEVVDPWTDFEGETANVTVEVNVTAAGEPYEYGQFDPPNDSDFELEIGNDDGTYNYTVPEENLTVTEHAEHHYTVEAAIPADEIEGYNLTVRFTGEKAGVAHTVSDSANILRPVLDTMDGLGTELRPYLITSATKLQAVDAATGNGTHFALATDIDASATEHWFGGKGFLPIGETVQDDTGIVGANGFNGTIEGNGYTITGITIDRGARRSVGVFGAVGSNGTIKDVTIANATVNGSDRTGALVGKNSGNLTRVTVENATVTTENDSVGGLVGRQEATATVRRGTANASVSGQHFVGGLVGAISPGLQDRSVIESAATGPVTGDEWVGGLVGDNAGWITASYATGDVTATETVGGLVGQNVDGRIDQSYARGNVTGDEDVGGLVGHNHKRGTTAGPEGGILNATYATGNVTGTETVGGLVGASTNGDIERSYWDVNATGQSTAKSRFESDPIVLFATKLTTDEMQGEAAESNMTAFDFEDTWVTTETYPRLAWHATDTGGRFDVTIVSTNAPITAGETLVVNGTVRNEGTATGSRTVNLFAVNDTVVDRISLRLDPDERATFTLEWDTDGVEPQELNVYLRTASGRQIPDYHSVEIRPPGAPAHFDVAIDGTNSPVAPGEHLTVDVTIENTGAQTGTQRVTLDAGGLGQIERQVTLGNGSTTTTFSLPTDADDAGEYTVTVTSANDTASTTVAVGDTAGDGGDPPASTGGGPSDTSDDGSDAATETPAAPAVAEERPITDGSAEFDGTERVRRVTFEDDVSGSVAVEEYADPPADVVDAVSRDLADADVTVVTAVDITPTSPAAESTAATVELTVDRDELADPRAAVIAHETDAGWERVETTVRESTDDTVTLAGTVESFSMFAVVEPAATATLDATTTSSTTTPAETESPPPTETPTSEPPASSTAAATTTDAPGMDGFGAGLLLVALVLATAWLARRGGEP